VLDVLLLVLATLRVACRRRSDLVLENVLLRHQLTVLTRPTRQRRRVVFRRLDKALWVLVRRVRPDWRRHLVVVTPATVIRWHRAGWRLYWRWRSHAGGGRPRLSADVRDLIVRMSAENPLWGSERIRGELLKLGVVVSNRSICRYRWRGPRRPPSQAWRTFLRNHAHAIWAADRFVVQTLTFKTLYVLLFIAHGRSELVHLSVTALWEGKTRRDRMERVGCGAMRGGRPGRGGPDVARQTERSPPRREASRRLLGSETVQTLHRRAGAAVCSAVVRRAGRRCRRGSRRLDDRLCQVDRVLPFSSTPGPALVRGRT
jgi:hypothetical protein